MQKPIKQFESFEAFWPYYMDQHRNKANRLFHVVGTLLGLLVLVYSLFTDRYFLLLGALVVGYGFSWFGHFVFEKNRPATWQNPWYSLRGDFRMLKNFFKGSNF